MTIEQKAKAYDDVVNKLRHFILQGVDPLITRTDVQDFFPELAEREDEKIKKEITELVMQPTWKTEKEFYRRKELCDWLEKQGEQKETLCDKCRKEQPSHSCQDITELGRCALEKQGEQKPVNYDCKEDEKIRKTLIENFKWFCGDFPETSKWGKDDNMLVKDIIAWLEKQGTSYTKRDVDDAFVEGMAFAKDELEKQGKQILANFAKTCKDEQKPAWDEKDESHLIHCVRLINNAEGCSISEQENAIVWLKSLKERIGGKV